MRERVGWGLGQSALTAGPANAPPSARRAPSYITAAINEIDIEQAFGLDPLQESPIAVCGFGPRAEQKTTVEFDPLGEVWDEDGKRR